MKPPRKATKTGAQRKLHARLSRVAMVPCGSRRHSSDGKQPLAVAGIAMPGQISRSRRGWHRLAWCSQKSWMSFVEAYRGIHLALNDLHIMPGPVRQRHPRL